MTETINLKNDKPKIFIKTISSTNNSLPSDSDLEFINKLQKNIKIASIYLIPNQAFSVKGQISIKLAGEDLIDLTDAEQIGVISLPKLNKELKANDELDIRIYNNADTNTIKLRIIVSITEELTNLSPLLLNIDKGEVTTGSGVLNSADGGSGIVATAYTCPTDKQAKIIVFETRVEGSGSATEIRSLIRGQRLHHWKNDTNDPHLYPQTTVGGGLGNNVMGTEARKIWSDGSYPEFNLVYQDFQDERLEDGETIAFDGNFSGNFNGDIEYSYSILEEDV